MFDFLTAEQLLSLDRTIAAPLFSGITYPWEILGGIKRFILELGASLPTGEYEEIAPQIWVARDAVIAKTASLAGPLIVDHESEIRHCAFIRGSAIVGKNDVVGNSTELKNCILFDTVQVPHFNYVGDSILGYHSHLGAGAVTSNVKSDRTNATILLPDGQRVETGLRKFGVILGDYTEVGCNSVLNPGTVTGRGVSVYPTSCVRGYIPERHIFKSQSSIVLRHE